MPKSTERKHPRVRLTKTLIDKIEPPAEDYDIYWDDRVAGYGLRVTASGVRSFVAQGRVNGKSVIVTIGRYGLYTEAQARERAQSLLQQMREGIDPREVRKAKVASSVTLADVCTAYLSRPGKLKQSTKDEYQRHVDRVFADWKDKPITAITEDMVRKRHRKLMESGLDGKRAAPASANAAMVTLRALINFASRQYRGANGKRLIAFNPTEVLADHWAELGDRSEKFIDMNKVGAVWNALTSAQTDPRYASARVGIELTRFILLTGARIDEARTLTWDRVQLDDHKPAECLWFLPDRKRGKDIWLPLNSQAVALLKACRQASDSRSVFPSPRSKTGHIQDIRSPMKLVSKIAGLHLSAHDVRRTFTNIALHECNIEKFRTDLLIGHATSSADVTARHYLHLVKLSFLHPEVENIGGWIEAEGKKAAGANVVTLPNRA